MPLKILKFFKIVFYVVKENAQQHLVFFRTTI